MDPLTLNEILIMSQDIQNTNLQTQMAKHPALLASVGAIRTKLNLKYTEEVYARTLADLAGTSFEPLAGIRVTFLPAVDGHVDMPKGDSNVIFSSHYVEYLTGHRRTLYAVVELVDGYVPVGVDPEAFGDAFRKALEYSLNECGYTIEESAPDGLRRMDLVFLGHDLLSLLFNPIDVLNGISSIARNEATITVEPDAVVVTAPINDFYQIYADHYFIHHDRPDKSNFNRIHRSRLGQLAELSGNTLWLTSYNGTSTTTIPYLGTEQRLVKPGVEFDATAGDTVQLENLNYAKAWRLNETPEATIRCLSGYVSGVVRDLTLTVRIPLDLSSSDDQGLVVFETIADWVEVEVQQVVLERYPPEGRQYAHDMPVMAVTLEKRAYPAPIENRNAVEAQIVLALQAVQDRAEAKRKADEEKRKAAIDAAVNTPSRYAKSATAATPKGPGFFARLRAAVKAFNNPQI